MSKRVQRVQRVQRKGLGSWIASGLSRVKEAFSSLFGDNRLPKSFRDTLKKYESESIRSIQVVREPLSSGVNLFANALTAGKFSEVAQKQGEAGFFHLFAILELADGTRLIYERNERPVLNVYTGKPSEKAESVQASGKNIPLGDFIKKSIDAVGLDKFVRYHPLENNCQDLLISSFQANGLLTSNLREFIKQDLTELIEETPTFSKVLAEKATSLAGKAREVFEELWRRKGGRIANLPPLPKGLFQAGRMGRRF
jgi:hypothetical protein